MTREDEKMVGLVAKAICKSWKFECGEGCCAAICMEALGDARSKCSHTIDVHGKLANAIVSGLPRPPAAMPDGSQATCRHD